MKFVNVKQFAELKLCSRETVYAAEKRGEIDINRSTGFPLIYLTKKNSSWIPGQRVGRPKKENKK